MALLTVATLMAVAMATGCSTLGVKTATREAAGNKKQAMDLFIEGKVAEAQENYAAAATSYYEALLHDPDSPEITQALARAFIKDGKLLAATIYSRKAVKLNPSNLEGWRMLQQLEQHNGNTAAAAEAMEMYIKLNPESDFFDTLRLAWYYFDLGREKEARSMLISLANQQETTAQEMIEIAGLFKEMGLTNESMSVSKRVVERDPLDVDAWLFLGDVYEQNARFDDALATYKEGLENNPDSDRLMIALGNLSLMMNDWDSVITYFENAIHSGLDNPKVEKVLCAMYFYAGRDSDGDAALARLVEAGEDDAPLYFYLGKAMNYLERYEKAVDYFQKGFSKITDDMQQGEIMTACRGYARALIYLDRPDDALDMVNDVGATFITDRIQIKVLEASIYMDLGRFEDAIAIYEWLLASDPKSVSFLLWLGQAFTSAGEYAKAEATLQKVPAIDKNNLGYLIQLSIVYDMSGQFDKAESALKVIIDREPDSALALNNLAYMYIEHDRNISKAIDMTKRALEIEPNNGAYFDTLGWGYFKQGKYDLARKSIEEALRLEDTPDRGVIYNHYGDVLNKLGMPAEARGAYKKAIDLGEDSELLQRKIEQLVQ